MSRVSVEREQAEIARYRGTSRRGVGFGGVLGPHASVQELVEREFRAGARSLTVTRDGETIGQIAPHPDTGRRVWWAQS